MFMNVLLCVYEGNCMLYVHVNVCIYNTHTDMCTCVHAHEGVCL